MKATTAWILIVLGFTVGIVVDYFAFRPPVRDCAATAASAAPSSSSVAPDPERMNWHFEFEDRLSVFSDDTPDCMPQPKRRPPTETGAGCIVEPHFSTIGSPSFTCGDWSIELSSVHARAGVADVRASMKYAGNAGDVGACQIVFRGKATAVR